MVYIELFHGRTDPDANLDDWGTQGPILGPFKWAHMTYKSAIRLGDAREGYDGEEVGSLEFHNDLVVYQGVYYGDVSIMGQEAVDALNEEGRARVCAFEESPTEDAPRQVDCERCGSSGAEEHDGSGETLCADCGMAHDAGELDE